MVLTLTPVRVQVGCLRQSEDLDKVLRCLSVFPAALNSMVDKESRAEGAGAESPQEGRELLVKVVRTTAGVSSRDLSHRSFPAIKEMTVSVPLPSQGATT